MLRRRPPPPPQKDPRDWASPNVSRLSDGRRPSLGAAGRAGRPRTLPFPAQLGHGNPEPPQGLAGGCGAPARRQERALGTRAAACCPSPCVSALRGWGLEPPPPSPAAPAARRGPRGCSATTAKPQGGGRRPRGPHGPPSLPRCAARRGPPSYLLKKRR